MKRIISLILCFIITTGFFKGISAEEKYNIDEVISDTAEYLYKSVAEPQVGSIGGEWAVLGLARSGIKLEDEYYNQYYKRVEEYVKEREGNLHDKKYTEYSRVITALTAIGKNPSDVSGYNLLEPLGDYEKTIWQGLNGPIWALIALDSGNYEIPKNSNATIQATREMYIQRILDCQLSDGGWSLFGGTKSAEEGDGKSDLDITGMALQALSKYRNNPAVENAITTALNTMSLKQDEKGGFSSWGTSNAESCVQMLVALCELGIAYDDSRFVKNGNTILDSLMTYYDKGNGFRHSSGGDGVNLMSTEQAFYGIVALKRFKDGKNSLYTMADALSFSDVNENIIGLKGKHKDIKVPQPQNYEKTFNDISAHQNKGVIEELSARNIINGKSENSFEPDSTMTRAEFAAIITKGLGIHGKGGGVFFDVQETDWFYNYVNTASWYGIINGVSEKEFNPNGNITRQEAAVMLSRAAKLCGMNTELEVFEVRNILCVFSDYVKAAEWAQSSLAFCYREKILDDSKIYIKPNEAVTRAEIAFMLYNMLKAAKLI